MVTLFFVLHFCCFDNACCLVVEFVCFVVVAVCELGRAMVGLPSRVCYGLSSVVAVVVDG